MAISTVQSDQLASSRLSTVEEHGKFRTQYFYYKNTSGVALDDGSMIDLVKLPPGRVRLLLIPSRWRISALGAGRVLSFGHRAYQSSGTSGNNIAEDAVAFASNIDVSAALVDQRVATTIKFDIYSKAEVVLFAKVTGGTIPNNAEIEGYFTYIYE